MATNTPNYNLKKPAPDDFYNVADQNENMDKIDAALKEIDDKTENIDLSGLATKEEVQTLGTALNEHKADYMYQIPSIVGAQIRLNRLSNTNRLFFKLENDLTGDITISTDNGETSKPLQDIEGNQITQLDKGFVEVVADATFFTLRNKGGLSGVDKQDLIDIVNEAERNESDLKQLFIDDINSKGASLVDNATWFDALNALSNMEMGKKWASGTVMSSSGTMSFRYISKSSTLSMRYVEVSGLTFKPTYIIVIGKGNLVVTSLYRQGMGNYDEMVIVTPNITTSGTSYTFDAQSNGAYVNSTGFLIPYYSTSAECDWIAIE